MIVTNITATSSTVGEVSDDTILTTDTAPQITTNTNLNTETVPTDIVSVTEVIRKTVPIGLIPNIEVKGETVSIERVRVTKVISETVPKTVPIDNISAYDTNSEMKSIFNHSPNPHLQSVMLDDGKSSNTKLVTNSLLRPIISFATNTVTISSPHTSMHTTGAKIAERSFSKSYSKSSHRKQEEDEVKVEPNYIRLKGTSTSPITTYTQSAPKTRLDQWKWEINQQQQQQQQKQSINPKWINNDNDNHNDHNNIINNGGRILSSSTFCISLFSLLFLLRFLFI